MLSGQQINVYTDHKNLTQDGLSLTSDRVTRWRILLEEYAPEIIYIEGIHNIVVDAISRLDYDPKLNLSNDYNHATHVRSTKEEGCQKWLMFSKFWSCYNGTQDPVKTNTLQMIHVFANHSFRFRFRLSLRYHEGLLRLVGEDIIPSRQNTHWTLVTFITLCVVVSL